MQDLQDFQDYTRVGFLRAGTVSAGHGRFPDTAIPKIVKIVKIMSRICKISRISRIRFPICQHHRDRPHAKC